MRAKFTEWYGFLLDRLSPISKFWFAHVYVELKAGQNIPTFYGWAGYNIATQRIVVLPLGLNLLWTGLTWFYFDIVEGCGLIHGEIQKGFQSRAQSYTFKTGVNLGARGGWEKGYMEGYTDGRNKNPNRVLGLRDAH